VAENFNKRVLELVEEIEQSLEDIGTQVSVLTSIVKDLEERLSALEKDREAS
jgi:chaperonin cofactor prefoldin